MENDIDFDAIVKQAEKLDRQNQLDEDWAEVFAQIAELRKEVYQPEIDRQISDSRRRDEAIFAD